MTVSNFLQTTPSPSTNTVPVTTNPASLSAKKLRSQKTKVDEYSLAMQASRFNGETDQREASCIP